MNWGSIEHSKLEFTLTLKIRQDPHILAQFKANVPPPAPASRPMPPPEPPRTQKSSGMRSFFMGSPKKSARQPVPRASPAPAPAPAWRMQENLARYLKADGTLARAFVAFRDVAASCDMRLCELALPLVGQYTEADGRVSPLSAGELVLQLFRLPPLPVPSSELPQSLEECERGLRHVAWHKATYFEGTLTQNGGDCAVRYHVDPRLCILTFCMQSWRRRHFRIIGANLVAFNDVTKKATATIDLRQALAVEDDDSLARTMLSPQSGSTAQSGSTTRSSRFVDELDGPGVERAFRVIFPDGAEIAFFADTDDEKARW
jgi:hypothetical protein